MWIKRGGKGKGKRTRPYLGLRLGVKKVAVIIRAPTAIL